MDGHRYAGGLGRFAECKKAEIEALRDNRAWLEGAVPKGRPRPGFRAALEGGRKRRGLALICEYKRASPSKGDIELSLSPEDAAEAYSRADCVSVLTEPFFFKGSMGFLGRMGLRPLLRKDFILDPLQVMDTALTPASAILVIIRMLDPAAIPPILSECASCGLEPVVEVFNEGELDVARGLGARLIQVNARDLGSLALDPDQHQKLIESRPPREGELFIAASGIKGPEDLISLRDAGYGAALIGTSLMRGGDPKARLSELLEGLGDDGDDDGHDGHDGDNDGHDGGDSNEGPDG
ncbi:MAG: indole-3-glycerol-phosphate synthase [Deltaproteobacteria bacterium]|jgi:indole-3-glycerol phosphate synthase|nr:indole-3-glycerol-phosphate synthase [Deltaproteobacteria bacterium]